MIRARRPHRSAAIPAFATGALALASCLLAAPSRAADATPEQAASIELAVRGFLHDMLGEAVPLGDRPVRATPAGDHYDAAIQLAPGQSITATVRQGDAGRWTFERLRYPSPVTFTTSLGSDGSGGTKDVRLTYNLKVAEQDGHGTIDPTFATPTTVMTSARGLDVTGEGAGRMTTSHVGRGSSETTLRPADNGLLDVIATSSLEDYTVNSTGRPGPKTDLFRIEAGKITLNSELDGVSRDRAPMVVRALAQTVASTMAAGANATSGTPPAMDLAPVRAFLAAIEGAAASARLDESVEQFRLVTDSFTVTLNRLRLGLGLESPSGVLDAHLDLGLDGLALPGVPLGPAAQFIPARISLRPVVSGVNTQDLLRALQASAAEGRPADAGPPPELLRVLQSGSVSAGLESFEIDLNPSVMTGMGKISFPAPGQLAGQGQVTATNFDALMDRVKAVPQAAQILPLLLFAKGVGRTAGDRLVWDITYDGAKVLVNGVDVLAMAGQR